MGFSRIHAVLIQQWIRWGFTVFGHLYILERHPPCIITTTGTSTSISIFYHKSLLVVVTIIHDRWSFRLYKRPYGVTDP